MLLINNSEADTDYFPGKHSKVGGFLLENQRVSNCEAGNVRIALYTEGPVLR